MHVSEKNLREAACLSLGEWRRLIAGAADPTLGQLTALADVLRTQIGDLMGLA